MSTGFAFFFAFTAIFQKACTKRRNVETKRAEQNETTEMKRTLSSW